MNQRNERTEQETVRFDKLKALREQGFTYPNDAKPSISIEKLLSDNDGKDLTQTETSHTLCGRVVQVRHMGKASFVHILDASAKMQVYVRKDAIGDESFDTFKTFDIGDIVETTGTLFTTKTGETTLRSQAIRLLSKCLIPLPEKWHGLTDVEARYRHRYVDLIANPEVRNVFKKRAEIIKEIRSYLDSHSYLEVETPVLKYVPGGAEAKPFGTHYNALHADMFLRIALELPLKKLVVGGLERVYEISRVFRNEGLSKKHNPEFTMLEFYAAYHTFEDMMNVVEELVCQVIEKVNGSLQLDFGDKSINFARPWKRISMQDSIHEIGGVSKELDTSTLEGLIAVANEHKIDLPEPDDWGRCLDEIWAALVEPKLLDPTFITHHPYSISPLARKTAGMGHITDRFELIISGMELSNAFSELNDPEDQRERFEKQANRKAMGIEDATDIDHDFLRALEYGMPPTGGVGIGIDRLVMLLTNSPTIRDVLLFPQLKPVEKDISDAQES